MHQRKNSSGYSIGLAFIIFGSLFILKDIDLIRFHWDEFWPIVPSLIALTIWINFLMNPRKYDLLMPATILTVYSALFWSVLFIDRLYFSDLWPVFLLGPALGFWLLQLSPYSPRNYLVPALILTGLAVIFLLDIHYRINANVAVGIALVLIGLIISVKRNSRKHPDHMVEN
ncbi:MAG: hypothetical protein KDD94_02850 [Calditrichaeota bacterium]|nr:hypothetical protein [Calditrichota bacterium]